MENDVQRGSQVFPNSGQGSQIRSLAFFKTKGDTVLLLIEFGATGPNQIHDGRSVVEGVGTDTKWPFVQTGCSFRKRIPRRGGAGGLF